ncbi:MAG: DUF5050 domain-containing protein [Lachnospiraceae bacterium]|nr:DUF5050 domain-containing protein [Lachnospiraceae bacterium]
MKKRIITSAALLVCMVLSLMAPMAGVNAAAKEVIGPNMAVRKGNYIYYAKEMDGARTGIIRYDISTKKKKEIVPYEGDNGYYNLNIKGNNLIYARDFFNGTAENCDYIYKANRNTGKQTKLGLGTSPVVIGKYIYYLKVTKSNDGISDITITKNKVYRMTLDGKNKKKVGKINQNVYDGQLYKYGNKVVYRNYNNRKFYDLNGKCIGDVGCSNFMSIYDDNTLKTGDYTYTFAGDEEKATLVCQKGDKSTEVFEAEGLRNVYVLGDYLLVTVNTVENEVDYKGYLYVIKNDGTEKKQLMSWNLGE